MIRRPTRYHFLLTEVLRRSDHDLEFVAFHLKDMLPCRKQDQFTEKIAHDLVALNESGYGS